MTDDEAVILMVDSNIQREHILPSEKAFAYKMKMEAITHQGKTTSRQVGEKSWSVEQVSQNSNDSQRQVHRYIRLTHLIPSILQMVDEYQIAFNPAVEISYLTEEHQRTLKEEMDACQATPSPHPVPHPQTNEQGGNPDPRNTCITCSPRKSPTRGRSSSSIRRTCSGISPSTTPRSRCSRLSSICFTPGSTNAATTRILRNAEGGTP